MPQRRTYGLSSRTLGAAVFAAVIGILGLSLDILTDEVLDGSTKFWIIAGVIALIGFTLFWLRRLSTTVTDQRIEIRGFFRSRTIAWSDVQAIIVEINPGYFAQKDAPRHMVVLYDRDGRRVVLPAVNDKNLSNAGFFLDSVVESMTETWHRGRGDEWTAVPAIQSRAGERARYGTSAWVVGFGWAMLAIPVTMVIALVGIIGRPPAPWPLYLLFEPLAILVVPTIVFFVATALTAYRRNQARLGAGPHA